MNEILKDPEIEQSWLLGMNILSHYATGPEWRRGYRGILKMLADDDENKDKVFETARRNVHGSSISFSCYSPGYLYLLHSDNHLFKIGKSKDPKARLTNIGLIVPNEVTLIHTVFTDAVDYLEKQIHLSFADRRVRGEWFRLSFWDLLYFFRSETNPWIYFRNPHGAQAEDGLLKSFNEMATTLATDALPLLRGRQ